MGSVLEKSKQEVGARSSVRTGPKSPHEIKVEKCLQKLKALSGESSPKGGSVSDSAILSTALPSRRKASPAFESESASEGELRADAKALTSPEELKDVYFSQEYEKIDKFRIKLLITALTLKGPITPQAKLKSAATKKLGISKFGTVHTAIQAGTQIIEWNNSSLVIPQDAASFFNRKTLLALDMELVEKEKFNEDVIPKICEVIAKWNGTKQYNEISANCQDFTSDLLKEIGISESFHKDSKIKKFLDGLDSLEKENPSFKYQFDNGETHTFVSHSVLDQVCYDKLKDKDPSSEEWRLLKAFDRVFWLRYHGVLQSQSLSEEERNNLLDTYKCCQVGCFFGDPSQGATLFGLNSSINLVDEEEEKEEEEETEIRYETM